MRRGNDVDRLPIVTAPKAPPMSVLYRRDQTFVVWDERGMTIRMKDKVRSTRMPELAVSPKLFSRDEIRKNLKLFADGSRKKEADALSGSRRFGSVTFLLLRWSDGKGTPWLEALVSVDLAESNPKPKLVGRFEGMTLAKKPIDDQLFVQDAKISAITQTPDTWGLSTFDPEFQSFDYLSYGDRLKQFLPLQWPSARFVEDTAYGTTVAGQVNLRDGDRKTLAEGRGNMRLVDNLDPPLVSLVSVDGAALRNADTGSELALPKSFGIRRGKNGVLVWTPLKDPTKATLYDPKAWTVLGEWKPG